MTLRSDPNFEEKSTFCLKNDMRKLVDFNASSGKSEKFYFDELFCRNAWAKKYKRIIVKNDLWFQKWHKEFGEFSHKYLKVMLDRSSVYNVLDEGMYFLDKNYQSNFNIFGLFTACLKMSKFLMWFLKPVVSFCINFVPFCNNLARTKV